MSGLVVVAAVAKAGFYRCAQFFPHEGITVPVTKFTNEQWDRIKNEPQLRLSEPTEADLRAADAVAEAADARRDQIVEIIKTLEPGDFDNSKKPKVAAINALLEEDQTKVNSGERDAIWEELQAKSDTAQD